MARGGDWKQSLKSTLVACAMVRVAPASSATHHFAIPAGEAAQTLMQFGTQANESVIYDFSQVQHQWTRTIEGELEITDALQRMLASTGLEFHRAESGTIFVTVTLPRTAPVSQKLASTHDSNSTENRPMPSIDTVSVQAPISKDPGSLQIEPSAALVQFNRSDIEHAGGATLTDFVHLLPSNFGGGANDGTPLFGREARTNPGFGSGMNLHGLGSRATLVLVNGVRLAPSGSAGAFTDVSNIPLVAIDDVELISGGGSTLHGEDAIGGIVNFVLRNDPSGSQTIASIGGGTNHSLAERLLGQSLSFGWEYGAMLLGGEYYERDPLYAAQRALATSNLTPWGGFDFGNPAGNPATLVDSAGQQFRVPAAQNGTALNASQLAPGQNLHNRFADATIAPYQQRLSFIAIGHQDLSDDTSIWMTALASRRHVEAQWAAVTATLTIPATNPWYWSPNNLPIQAEYGFGADLGPQTLRGTVYSDQCTLGLTHLASHNWTWTGYVSSSEEDQRDTYGGQVNFTALDHALADPDPATAFNVFGDGSHTNPATISTIRAQSFAHYSSELATLSGQASGPLLTLRTGDVALTFGTDYRRQTFLAQTTDSTQPTAPSIFNGHRNLIAAYAQTSIPLLGSADSASHSPRLELTLGLREERYSDVGSALSGQRGLTFWPTPNVSVGASWAQLFRPPNLSDLSQAGNISEIVVLADSQSPSGSANTLVLAGGNRNLQSESAQDFTAHVTFRPLTQPEVSTTLTYFRTIFSQIVQSLDLSTNALQDPLYQSITARDLTDAQRSEICTNSQFFGVPGDCKNATISALVDLRLHNAETLKTDGFDLTARLPFETGLGRFVFDTDSTYILRYAQATTPTSPIISLLNHPHYPLSFRARTTAGWERRDLWLAATFNYQGGYKDTDSDPNRTVSSWTTWDLSAGYRMSGGAFWTNRETQIVLSARNLFNRNPPFLNNSVEQIGYDQENGNLLGRRVQVEVRLKW